MRKISVLFILFLFVSGIPGNAQDAVEIDFLFYCDRLECEVMQDLLDRFNEDNSDITVNLQIVLYSSIDTELPTMIADGDAPDMARITNFGAYRGQYLDLRPYIDEETATFWQENFPEPVLVAMREAGDSDGLHGFPDSLTVTGPFINRSMFDGAGVPLPNEAMEQPTWNDWVEAASQVAEVWSTEEKPVWALAIDRSGHRIAGPAMSMGATFFDSDGNFTIDTQGFRDIATMLKDWHDNELMPASIWLDSGTGYIPAGDFFVQGQAVIYMSGSWNLARFSDDTSIQFIWDVVPNPSGAGGSTGIAGGAGIVAFKDTDYPEAVASVMSYLIQTDTYTEYSAYTLQLPAHEAVVARSVPYLTTNSQLFDGLAVFSQQVGELQDQAIALNVHPFAFAYYRNSANRISQYIEGELTLDEALSALQADIDAAVVEAEANN